MKRFILLTLAILSVVFLSCSKERTDSYNNAKVHIAVNDFTILQDDFPSAKGAQSTASYTNVKAMTLAFYDDNDVLFYDTTQLRADASTYDVFGEFDLTLPIGNYTMVVLGYASEQPITLISKTDWAFTSDKVRETFAGSQNVNILNTEDVVIAATLNRVVAKMDVISSDGRPANVASVRMTFSGGAKGINPITGLATSDTGWVNTISLSSAVGATTKTLSMLFLATDQQSMNVTIDALDSDGTSVSHKVVNNVPLQRNKVTQLTGSLYSASETSSFSVETSWISDTNRVSF